MKTEINIIIETLTDGSKVFAVEIGQTKIDCLTEKDAMALAEKFVAALDKHTP